MLPGQRAGTARAVPARYRRPGPLLDQQPEEAERAFPFVAVHGLQLCVDDLERPGQGDADAAEDQRQAGPRLLGQRRVERRACRQVIEDEPELGLRSMPSRR
jgi:hypothetical protein